MERTNRIRSPTTAHLLAITHRDGLSPGIHSLCFRLENSERVDDFGGFHFGGLLLSFLSLVGGCCVGL